MKSRSIIVLCLLMTLGGADIARLRAGNVETVGLGRASSVKIDGANRPAAVGDFNGDGHNDIAVSDCVADDRAGVVYLLFGPLDQERVDLTQRDTWDGIHIKGSFMNGAACSISPAGDVNGDGLQDLLVGATGVDNNKLGSSGSVYVIFGRTDPEPTIELATFDQGTQGMGGFRIDGPISRSRLGETNNLDVLGDVNGDGLDDLLLGAPFAASSYVIFGKKDPSTIQLAAFSVGTVPGVGYEIRTVLPHYNDQYTVVAAGDVNGDGVPDAILSARRGSRSHAAYVVFGDPLGRYVDTRREGEWGFKIKGPRHSNAGASVAGLGDVNGDGLGDLAVGAPSMFQFGIRNGREQITSIGSAFVVFGKSDHETIRLKDLGERGYRTLGASRKPFGDRYADQVGRIPDVNGDGIPELLVGASYTSRGAREGVGSVYLLFGKTDSRSFRVKNLGSAGIRFDGWVEEGQAGFDFTLSEDVTGDGLPDLLIGTLYQQVLVVSVPQT